MRTLSPLLIKLMGLIVQGDIGPWTCYHHPGQRTVAFPHAPPTKPPTRRQIHQRNKLRLTAQLWQSLSHAQRNAWERAAMRATLRITGYNLYTAAQLLDQPSLIATIEHSTHIHLARHPDDV